MLPGLDELLSVMRVVRLPMNTTFRGVNSREIALFESPHGWVEFSPFLEYEPSEASTWLASALDTGWQEQPQFQRTSIPVNATLPDVKAADVPKVMERYGDLSSLHTVKVKVGGFPSKESSTGSEAAKRTPKKFSPSNNQSAPSPLQRSAIFDEDCSRLRALRSFVGESVRVRIDVNGTWNLEEASSNLEALENFGLEYVEQPVASVEDMARLREILARKDLPIKIAADENIRKASDPLRVKELGAADLVVVKAQPLGGANRILDIVNQVGLPAVVSSALDSAVGIAFGARVAASLPRLDYACGLGTGALFKEDLTGGSGPGSVQNFTTQPGWAQVDSQVLAGLAVEKDRYLWWENRVKACYRFLQQRECTVPENC